MNHEVAELIRLTQKLGVAEADLDEAVHECAQNVGLKELNRLDDENDQEEHVSSVEEAASHVNNQGIEAQIAFLLGHSGYEATKAMIEAAGH